MTQNENGSSQHRNQARTLLHGLVQRSTSATSALIFAVVGWGGLNAYLGKGTTERLEIESADFASEKQAIKQKMKAMQQPAYIKEPILEIQPKNKRSKEANMLLNDPFVKEKWGLLKTNTKQAWDISKGSRKIVVAVIDTGIDVNHRDLSCNIFVNPGESGPIDSPECNQLKKNGTAILNVAKCNKATNGKDDDGNGRADDVHGWNFVQNNNELADSEDHGTHIAGIIGACGNDDYGVSGVAPEVSIMALKYYDRKVATNNLKNTIDAIRYTVDLQKKNKDLKFIINYSGGGTEFSADEFSAIKDAERNGILFVAAAGNERSNSDEPGKHYYPADYELTNIISVTAVNREETKVLASSNFGVRTVDLAAPGENIYSTKPGNSFGLMTGTSQATAFVTGVAVLVMASNREFAASDIKKYILRTGDEYTSLLSKTGTAKLLNSYRALTSLDMGVSFAGKIASNTAGLSKKAFQSEPNLRDPKLIPSALTESGDEESQAAQDMATFSRDFLRAVKKTGAIIEDVDAPDEN